MLNHPLERRKDRRGHMVYDTGKGWFQGDLSDAQRDQAQERGFS
ncbi:hypothetical protein GCM10011581_49230 [Saccharopolyspora subtropica]|uniref:Uncharacterized protein n=2 Tax=Saccharopolyspora thermophila TaxID=89367 RepID=A0A917KAZ6_9PSEU|nr:hypothetical protein GCM10011581_49230 [Saccharopolyspora subtropica]